jgi:hypothetical protein
MYLRRGFLASAADEWVAVAQERPDAQAYVGLAQVAFARGLADDSVLYFHPYEFTTEPLQVSLPPSPSLRQRLTASSRSLWRNSGRTLVARRLREVARTHRLVSYDQAYDDITRRYGTRSRALSEEGVLV